MLPPNYGVVISGRMGSSRLPGKAVKPLMNIPMILFLLDRIKTPGLENQIVFATTDLPEDNVLAELVSQHGFPVFRGSNEDVAKRLLDVAKEYQFEYVCRVTGDCPFVNMDLIKHCVVESEPQKGYHLSTTKGIFPQGLDCEIFHAPTLQLLYDQKLLTDFHKEHVTAYFYEHDEKFCIHQVPLLESCDIQQATFTVDTQDDYLSAQRQLKKMKNPCFSLMSLKESMA